MVGAVIEDDTEVDGGKSGKDALLSRLLDSFFDGGNVVPRDRTAENFIHEFKIRTSGQRLHADFAVAVLAVTAGLLLVLALYVGPAFDGLAVWNFGRF